MLSRRSRFAGALIHDDGWRSGAPPAGARPRDADAAGPHAIGLAAVLATVVMLFTAFTAALLVRRAGADWVPVRLPPITLANTAALVLSSLAVEHGRRRLRGGDASRAVRWIAAGMALGILFLAGQAAAWAQLAARGVFLPSSPHASFFYMLSAAHGAHVLGGLAALGWTLRRAAAPLQTRRARSALAHAAVFWHAVGAVWLYLLVLLSVL